MLRSRTLGLGTSLVLGCLWACSSNSPSSFFGSDASTGGPGGGDGGNTGADGSIGPPPGNIGGDGGGPQPTGDGGLPEGSTVVVSTTIYANTDDSLYSLDPKATPPSPKLVGTFAGVSDASSLDSTITDVAVNGAGDVYVNTESVVYKAVLPPVAGVVQLTKVATIAATSGTRFYALAFTPPDALGAGTGEVLIGGDGNGEVWSIDIGTATPGATKDLGNFGTDPSTAGNFLALSGDLVFYNDASNKPTGLATIRSCTPPSGSSTSPACSKTNDFLAGVDMTAMGTAFSSGTPAKSLNGGIYGGSATATGNGIGHGEVFGLGAWEGSVYGFARYQKTGSIAPVLLSIDATATGGAGTVLPGNYAFTNGWSGAGVTSKVTITIPPPPPPPPPPK